VVSREPNALWPRAQKAVENPAHLGRNGEPILAFVALSMAQLSRHETLRLSFQQ
jgi:hypothetical protein